VESQVVSILNEKLLLFGDLGEYLWLLILFWFSLLIFCLFCGLSRSMCVAVSNGIDFFVRPLFFKIYFWTLELLAIRFNQEFVLFSILLCQKLLRRSIEIYRSEIFVKRIRIHDLGDKHSIFIIQLALKYKLFFDLSFSDTIFLCGFCLALDTLLAHVLRLFLAVIWLCAVKLSFLIVKNL